MTSKLDTERETPAERASRRRYRVQLTSALLSYFAVLAAVMIWGDLGGDSPWRFALVVLPVLPTAWIAVAAIRRFRELDEYQVRLAFPGIAAGFTVAVLAAVTIGFLGIAGLAVPFAGWIVFVAGMLAWWIANQVTGAAKLF